jgi:hypothetical protein
VDSPAILVPATTTLPQSAEAAFVGGSDRFTTLNQEQISVNAQTFARMASDIALLSEEKKACSIEKDNLANEKLSLFNEIAHLEATVAALKRQTGDQGATGRRHDGKLAKFAALSSKNAGVHQAMTLANAESMHEPFGTHNGAPGRILNTSGKFVLFNLDMSACCALRTNLTVATKTANYRSGVKSLPGHYI